MSNEPMGEPIEYDGDEEKHLYRRLSQALLEEQEDDEESPLEDDEDPTESTRCDVCGFSRFPRGAIAVIFLAMLESWNQNTIWPFLPSFVARMGIAEENIGYYAGFVGAAFFAGQGMTGYLYGRLADNIGRRPVLLWGTCGTAVSALFFGFSPNLTLAVLARFFGGALNGNSGVCKTYLGEVTDKTNQAKAFSGFAFLYGFGSMLAPSFGGYLSEPAITFPSLFKGTIFDTFPYALPCCFSSLLAFCAFIWGFFTVPETESFKARQREKNRIDTENAKLNGNGSDGKNEIDEEDFKKYIGSTFRECVTSVPGLAILIQCCHGIGSMANNELGPLYLKTDANIGGMGFSPREIALVMMAGGFTLLTWQGCGYERVVKRLGATRFLRLGFACLVPVVLLYPVLGNLFSGASVSMQVLVICVAQGITRIGNGSSISSLMIVANNSVPDSIKGRVNGFAQTSVSLLRMAAPIVVGSVFAFSLSLGSPESAWRVFPAFILVAILFGSAAWMALLLPKYLDEPFDPEKAFISGRHRYVSLGKDVGLEMNDVPLDEAVEINRNRMPPFGVFLLDEHDAEKGEGQTLTNGKMNGYNY